MCLCGFSSAPCAFSEVFSGLMYKTHVVRNEVTKSGEKKKGGVEAVSISTRQQEFQGWPHSISDIELETKVKIGSSRLQSHAHRARQCSDERLTIVLFA